jgi:hypothetical protein
MAEAIGMQWPTIRADEWPFGVRCMDCERLLNDGDAFIERLGGFAAEVPTTEVVCLLCGGVPLAR